MYSYTRTVCLHICTIITHTHTNCVYRFIQMSS